MALGFSHLTTRAVLPSLRLSTTFVNLRRRRRNFCNCYMEGGMPNKARVAVAQMTSTNDLDANFNTCSRLTQDAVEAGAKLVCFPENFSFVGAREGESLSIAEGLDGPIMQRYCGLARKWNIWLSLGGFQEKGKDDRHLCNTHVLVDNMGTIRSKYRKIHLFDVDVPGNVIYKESAFTTPGTNIVVEDSPLGLLGLTVCYDLRFPELYQLLRFQYNAQVLLVPSAFTKVTGQAHWEILLRARAIETQCYVIAAAQAGKHNEKRESYGDSLIIDPWGTVVARLSEREVIVSNLVEQIQDTSEDDVLSAQALHKPIPEYLVHSLITVHWLLDRLSTGIAVADIDFSMIDAVRTKMPIQEHRRPSIYGKDASL